MSVRILHLIGGGEVGGAERHVLNLLENMPPNTAAYLGCLIKGSPFASLARGKGIETKIFPMHFSLDLSPLCSLISFCRQKKINLIHCHGTRANLLGRFGANLLSIPAITTWHSIPETDYSSSWKGRIALLLDNLSIGRCSGMIAVSDYIRQAVTCRLPSKWQVLPFKTIYNGYPVLDFSEAKQYRQHFRTQWHIPDKSMIIGTIGRLHPVKGQKYLIEAFALLLQEFPNLHLLLIGEGSLYNEFAAQLSSFPAGYTLAGYLPEAWQALPAMDIFVLPSLSEGMGLVLLEAAQAGIPIVASNIGGIPELFRNNTEALLTGPGDAKALAQACRRILTEPVSAQELAYNAREKALTFSIDKMVSETTAFYEMILAEAEQKYSLH